MRGKSAGRLVAGGHALSGAAGPACWWIEWRNLIGALMAAQQMKAAGSRGRSLAILCDGGERYADTYYDQGWRRGMSWSGLIEAVAASAERGEPLPTSVQRASI